MVSRILILIALLFSSVAMSQEESALKFNQVLFLELSDDEPLLVPEGKAWKITSVIYDMSGGTGQVYFKINSINIDVYRYFAGSSPINFNSYPIWLPSQSIIEQGYGAKALSIIEFNTN